MREIKKRYVAGYKGERQCIYGKDFFGSVSNKNWADPMTFLQAKRYVKNVNDRYNLKGKKAMTIFEITEVDNA